MCQPYKLEKNESVDVNISLRFFFDGLQTPMGMI